MEVYRINMRTITHPSCTTLQPLLRHATQFAVAMYKDEIVYLSGSAQHYVRSVWTYHISSNEWNDAPPLNHSRFAHSSICMGEQVYVIGGLNKDGSMVGTIESIRVCSDEPWKFVF